MTEKVVRIANCTTTLDIEPDVILQGAIGRVVQVVVIGRMENGEIYLGGSSGLRGENLWLIEKGREFLLNMA